MAYGKGNLGQGGLLDAGDDVIIYRNAAGGSTSSSSSTELLGLKLPKLQGSIRLRFTTINTSSFVRTYYLKKNGSIIKTYSNGDINVNRVEDISIIKGDRISIWGQTTGGSASIMDVTIKITTASKQFSQLYED